MGYDEAVAERVRGVLGDRPGLTERKMFGGVAFMVNGHMAAGVLEDHLVLRLGNDQAEAALAEPHTRPMDFTGRVMRSMIYVDPPGFATDDHLGAWLDRAVGVARSLPPK